MTINNMMKVSGRPVNENLFTGALKMDKGFNDDELADIMNEIESLEKEFSGETQESEPQASAVSEPISEDDAEQIMMQDMESEQQVATEANVDESPVAEVADTPVAEVADTPAAEVEEVVEQVHEDNSDVDDDFKGSSTELNISAQEDHNPTTIDQHPESEVLDDLVAMEANEVTPHHSKEDDKSNIHTIPHQKADPVSHHANGHHTSMNFAVEGDMKLNLNFNISGKTVSLNIADDHFSIELEGGMSFNIPLDQSSHNKKAA